MRTLCGRRFEEPAQRPLQTGDKLCRRCADRAPVLPTTGVVWLDQGVLEVPA
jgi:hypothetical protein